MLNITTDIPADAAFFIASGIPYKTGKTYIGRARCNSGNAPSSNERDFVNLYIEGDHISLYTGTILKTLNGSYQFSGCYICD